VVSPAQPARPAAPQRSAAATQPPPQAVRPPTRGVLIVVSGALAGQRVDVGAQPVTIGKGPATIQISDDPAVSTRHAEVALRGGAFVVTDLGSTNGTFVGGAPLAGEHVLRTGDELRIGETELRYED